MPVISFFNQEVTFPFKNKPVIQSWLLSVAKKEKKNIVQLQYIFCNDAHILHINKTFLKHDYYTDIITFDYSQNNDLQGEIYISLETVQSNARNLNVLFDNELYRVIVHGLLHLSGYKDKSKSDIALMRKKEDEYLALLSKITLTASKKK
jgi:probable rRNA maturation factor